MTDPSPPDRITARRAQFFILFSIFYLGAELLCLQQWRSPQPWSRLDRFSGGYILISLLWLQASRGFLRTFSQRKDVGAELSGAVYDP